MAFRRRTNAPTFTFPDSFSDASVGALRSGRALLLEWFGSCSGVATDVPPQPVSSNPTNIKPMLRRTCRPFVVGTRTQHPRARFPSNVLICRCWRGQLPRSVMLSA